MSDDRWRPLQTAISPLRANKHGKISSNLTLKDSDMQKGAKEVVYLVTNIAVHIDTRVESDSSSKDFNR